MRNPTKKGQYHEALAELELFNAQPAHMVPAPREGGGCINAKAPPMEALWTGSAIHLSATHYCHFFGDTRPGLIETER